MVENYNFDKKSIRIIKGASSNLKELAKDCVCFANAYGGEIHIGIEDNENEPPPNQKIPNSLIQKILKTIPSLTVNVAISAKKSIAKNGGEFIIVTVYRSSQTIASTSDGRYYIRVSDECKPVLPDEMARLASDKNAFIWEEKVVRKIHYSDADAKKLKDFFKAIRTSERVSKFVKEKTDEELLEYYTLTENNYLTNLGILWLGNREQRKRLHYAPSVQLIKYDNLENKIFKKVWDDFEKNPQELLEDIVNNTPDWNEYIEISDGIFRKNIYNYDPEVIRELLANAFAHRNYSMKGDIFINIYPDHIEIHSPGLLPIGVTPKNILYKSVQRNYHLSKLFYDLRLMEKEGSGYDKVYEILLANAKKPPIVEEGDDRVVVSIFKNIISKKVLMLMKNITEQYQLKQKETIILGIIAQAENIQATTLSEILNIDKANGIQRWLGRLLDLNIVLSKGKTKGKIYYVNPDFLRKEKYDTKTTLKRIEPHRLKELIIADLNDYPNSSISDIHKRIGLEINQRTLRNKILELVEEGLVEKKGTNRWTKYYIGKKA